MGAPWSHFRPSRYRSIQNGFIDRSTFLNGGIGQETIEFFFQPIISISEIAI